MAYQRKAPLPPACGMLLTKMVLHGKWKSSLLHHIGRGVQRPGALQRQIPAASRRVLSVQLHELEQHGLVGKTVHEQRPPKVEYYLTELGRSLLPLIGAMTEWGNEHRDTLALVLNINRPAAHENGSAELDKFPIDGPHNGDKNQKSLR